MDPRLPDAPVPWGRGAGAEGGRALPVAALTGDPSRGRRVSVLAAALAGGLFGASASSLHGLFLWGARVVLPPSTGHPPSPSHLRAFSSSPEVAGIRRGHVVGKLALVPGSLEPPPLRPRPWEAGLASPDLCGDSGVSGSHVKHLRRAARLPVMHPGPAVERCRSCSKVYGTPQMALGSPPLAGETAPRPGGHRRCAPWGLRGAGPGQARSPASRGCRSGRWVLGDAEGAAADPRAPADLFGPGVGLRAEGGQADPCPELRAGRGAAGATGAGGWGRPEGTEPGAA